MEEIGSGILDKHPGSATLVGTDHPFLATKGTGNNPLRKNMYYLPIMIIVGEIEPMQQVTQGLPPAYYQQPANNIIIL
jgi:hypothetical protein